VARRAPEIATLRITGFSRGAVLAPFLLEAVLVPLAGGATGCAPALLAAGMSFAVAMGVLGGLFPAWSASRRDILRALKS
jgi:ABC-type antimicrobial peptide transport system permease subunit